MSTGADGMKVVQDWRGNAKNNNIFFSLMKRSKNQQTEQNLAKNTLLSLKSFNSTSAPERFSQLNNQFS
jgi:hypothetical protein